MNILNRYFTIAKGIVGVAAKKNKNLADEYFTRAMFDPDYAETIYKAYNKNKYAYPEGILDRNSLEIVKIENQMRRMEAEGQMNIGNVLGAFGAMSGDGQ